MQVKTPMMGIDEPMTATEVKRRWDEFALKPTPHFNQLSEEENQILCAFYRAFVDGFLKQDSNAS